MGVNCGCRFYDRGLTPGKGRDFSFPRNSKTSFEAVLTFYLVGTRGVFHRDKSIRTLRNHLPPTVADFLNSWSLIPVSYTSLRSGALGELPV